MVVFPGLFGPVGFFSGFFLNPQNVLVALALVVPLILLYLIRPKPQNVAVPSLMFILKDMGKSTIHRFFRTIFRDILFLLQVFAILLLGLALAKPFLDVSQASMVHQSILVVDTSASMRANNDDRFNQAIDAAVDALASENVVIVAREHPTVLDVSGEPKLSAGKAKSLLRDLEPTDLNGDLPSALDLAAQYVGPQTKVTVISDFVLSPLESQEFIEAKIKVLRSKGAIVDIVPIPAAGRNVGIIDASIAQNGTLALKVQNFDDKPEEFFLEYNGAAITLPKNLLAPAGQSGSLLSVSVPIAHGATEIRLKPDDDFLTDNHYYLSLPERDATNILLISNDPAVQQSKVVPALTAAGDQFTRVNIQYAAPPKIPDLNHDVYIIKDINTDFMLPGVVRDLRAKVEAGAVLVVFAQQGLFALDMQDMLPVQAKPDAQPLGGRQEIVVNESLGLLRGLSDIGQVDGNELQRVNLSDGGVMHAYVQTNDGPEPVIAHKRVGKGVVIYYGIQDRRAVDIDTNAYVIIWGRMIDYSIPDIRVLNIGTGAVITSQTKTVATPMGKIPPPVLASRAGLYTAGPSTMAANLYPLRTGATTEETSGDATLQYESTINRAVNITAGDGVLSGTGNEEIKVPWELTTFMLLGAGALMLLELLYVKFRGDL
jgi:hypothetical protein